MVCCRVHITLFRLSIDLLLSSKGFEGGHCKNFEISFTEVVKAVVRLLGKLTSEVLFCFPGLRFDVFSPYRDGRYCDAPKPRKEEQKSYNYCSAILIVHRFNPSFLCSPRHCVKSGARLRRKSFWRLVVTAGRMRSANAIGYAKHRSRSHNAVIRVYDAAGNVIETHEHKGEFKNGWSPEPSSPAH